MSELSELGVSAVNISLRFSSRRGAYSSTASRRRCLKKGRLRKDRYSSGRRGSGSMGKVRSSFSARLSICSTRSRRCSPTRRGSSSRRARRPRDLARDLHRFRCRNDGDAMTATANERLLSRRDDVLMATYARPPAGELRLRPPQPPAPWTGTREAAGYGNRSLQPPGADPAPDAPPVDADGP